MFKSKLAKLKIVGPSLIFLASVGLMNCQFNKNPTSPAADHTPITQTRTPGIATTNQILPLSKVAEVSILLRDRVPTATSNIRSGNVVEDGTPQLIVSEPLVGAVVWLKAGKDPTVITEGLIQPVRTHVTDLDGDGFRDILVADIGSMVPTNRKVGKVVLLKNGGDNQFDPIVLLEGVGRTVCAEAADLDADGDLDISVCVFGHRDGRISWLEQKKPLVFEEHILDARPGGIHALPFDADGDGDLDLAVSISQDSEEILLFKNDGAGNFEKEVLFSAGIEFYGMSGIELIDLDQDADTDILITNGDEFDKALKDYDPYNVHGLAWLENNGKAKFTYHDILRHWGAYAVKAIDIDTDSDLDLVLSTVQNPSNHPKSPVRDVMLLENDGSQNFSAYEVEGAPKMMVTLEIMDFNQDGIYEILGGTLDMCNMDVFATNSAPDTVHWDPQTITTCPQVGHRVSSFLIK